MAEENPNIRIHQVPGNCDRYRMVRYEPEIRCYPVCGIKMYMTHGHLHNVKMNLHHLLLEARKLDAQMVLYGHTHIADCHREEDGLWVMNPGACGSSGGSVGLIEIQDGVITECGTHEELLRSCETYREMAVSQLSEKELGLEVDA